MSEVNLNDGDGLFIATTESEFMFKCCDCGLIHKITVDQQTEGVTLKFYREEQEL